MKPVVAFLAIILAGCATVPPAEANSTPGLGQVANIGGLRIQPLAVREDSRCPALVRCVWEGRLVVSMRISGSGWTQTRDLELGVPQAVAAYRVALIAAGPPKAAPTPIEPRAYRFTFAVSGR